MSEFEDYRARGYTPITGVRNEAQRNERLLDEAMGLNLTNEELEEKNE